MKKKYYYLFTLAKKKERKDMSIRESNVKHAGLAELLKETDELIEEGKNYLVANGQKIDFTEWVTLKEYTKRHNLESTNVVTNWIRRGIIPEEDVRVYDFLNDLRLIRDKEYK